jgi:hypothetical protein
VRSDRVGLAICMSLIDALEEITAVFEERVAHRGAGG